MANFGIFKGFSDKLFEGEFPINLGTIGTIDLNPLLLDEYPNAAAAYGLRKLTKLYTGYAIRVRRSIDNIEQNIGFSDVNLDTSALLSFCGSGDGFVTTWYDQSGNAKNATQTTAANQPQIVSSGSVISDGGKPTINQTSTQHLSVNNVVFISSFFVVKVNSQVVLNYFIATTSSNGSGGFFANGDFDGVNGFGGFDGSNLRSLTGEDLNRHIAYYNTFGGNLNVSKDNNSITNIGVFASSLTLTLLLGRATSSGLSLQGNSQEMIFYNSNQASNRTGIQSNINDYYGIY